MANTLKIKNNYDRALKLSHSGTLENAYIHIDDSTVMALAGKQVGLISSKDSGNILVGDVGIKAKPENVTIAQLYKLNNVMMSLLPSTIYTPLPTFKEGYTDKVERMGEIMSHVQELKGLLGALNG